MGELTGIPRWRAAAAAVAVIACGGVLLAQTGRPSAPPARARAAANSAQASQEAAAYQKLNSGQVDDAATAFQAILSAQPNDAGALAGMGQVRMLQGNYLGAVSFLERAKQASPNDETISSALDSARFSFLMGEGRDAQQAKDSEDAEKRYREALELRPDARQAVDALVNVLVLENKLNDAQDALSAAVAREASATGQPPADLEMQLAQLDIANSQPQLAYPIFLQVLQDNPQRVDAWSGLISSLHLMGHDADALAQEKVIPIAARAQLEATPGFQQTLTAMAMPPAAGAAQATAGQPSYAPFVPSDVPPAPQVAQPAPGTTPAVASVPAAGSVPRNLPAPAEPVNATSARRAATPVVKPAVTPVPQTAQTAHVHADAPQTTPPARRASSGSGAPLVTQPAARPSGRVEDVPDTGDQQYPQPKTRPRVPANSGSEQ
ncbi:MAG TPA: tetratricopeptide repeat protein [Acidobacteriaceae bacterium]|nr:tetratricopeptide repeat protein [Acidobacteriaceae bacterium]